MTSRLLERVVRMCLLDITVLNKDHDTAGSNRVRIKVFSITFFVMLLASPSRHDSKKSPTDGHHIFHPIQMIQVSRVGL